MLRNLIQQSGVVGLPLTLVSVLVLAYLLARLVAHAFAPDEQRRADHQRFLEPLGGIALSLGLLGSVVGFIRSFSSLDGAWDPEILLGGLSEAYISTVFGITLHVVVLVSSYFLNLNRSTKEDDHEECRRFASLD
ncbi:MAG: MotA/TolQ/ExbB proton channel family protein [Candidatus Omnitrophica bacterium]|nr:MotA/TolQ/ExbB proton channel family protein [Candidatus Omnitrophota bacterium]